MAKSTLSVLIGIMIITMPAVFISPQSPVLESDSGVHDFYSFTGLPSGTTPTGNSWIDFRAVNSTSGFGYSIKNTAYGNALHITSVSTSIRSYLDMQVNFSMPVSVSFYFMWNDTGTDYYRYDHIYFLSGNGNLLEYSFGVRNDVLESGFNTSNGGEVSPFVPVHNDIYRADVSFDPSLDSMSFKIENENTGNVAFPMFFNSISQRDTGNLSVLFGGLVSSVYIYNITVDKNLNTDFTGNTAGNFTYQSNSSHLSSAENPYFGNETHPLLDIPLNTVIYIMENGSVAGYNYFDHRSFMISQYRNGTFLKMETLQNAFYYYIFWFHSNSLQMQMINRTTLSLQNATFNGDFSGFSSLISGGNIVLYNYSGYLYGINTSNPGNLEYTGFLPSGYYIIGISKQNASLNLIASNGTEINHYRVLLPYLSYTETLEQNLGNYWRGFTMKRSVHGNSGDMAIMIPNSFSLNSNLLIAGEYTYDISPSVSVLSSGSSSLPIKNGNNLSILVGNEIYGTDVNLTSVSSTAYFMSNGSAGVVLTNGTITVYHSVRNYYSPYLDRISGISVYKNEGFLFNVTSFLPYTLKASLGNESFDLNNLDFLSLNLTSISSGVKVLKAIIANTAGYTYYYNYSFVVDNGIPDATITPSPDSYVSQNATFSVSITDNVTIDYVNLTLFNATTTFHSTKIDFSPDLYGFTGDLNITLLIVDDLGHSFTRYFNFIVMNETSAGFSWNLENGSYFSTANLHLIWVPVANVSQYSIFVSGDTSETFETTGTGMNITLMNGHYSIAIKGKFLDGTDTILGKSDITVITYRPEILISTGNTTYYSFHGNSVNSTFEMNVSSNITSDITINGVLPDGTSFLLTHGETSINVSIGKNFPYYFNGIYRFMIRSVSLSGTSNSTIFSINVNNTVPSFPTFSEEIYTNRSSITLPFPILSGLFYSAGVSVNGTLEEHDHLVGRELNLSEGQGSYLINFSAYSKSGNHVNSKMIVNYYYSPPAVMLQLSQIKLINVNHTTLHYLINDRTPLEKLVLHVGNTTIDLPVTNDSGSMRIWFAHNGNYSIGMVALDMCGNSNSSITRTVSVEYYDNITGAEIGISIVGTTAYLKGVEFGNHSHNLMFSWYLNGKYEGNSSTMDMNLPYGYNNVTLKVYFNGKTIEVSRKVLVVGWMPEISAFLVISGIASFRTLRIRRKLKAGIELVLKNKGRSVRDIVKAGKLMGIPGSSVRKATVKLANQGKISFDRDLDNNLFVKKQ